MTTAGQPTGYFNQTYAIEFTVTESLDGTTVGPPLRESPPTGTNVADPQRLFRREVERLGLIDPDYQVPEEEAGRRGTRGNRVVTFLWIEGPTAGVVGATVEVVDAVDGTPLLQETVTSLEGRSRFYTRRGIFIPQGSMLRLVGLAATPAAPIKVRLHIQFLDNPIEVAAVIEAIESGVSPDIVLQQFSGSLSVDTSIPGAALTPMPIDTLDFAFDPDVYEHTLGSSDVTVLQTGRYWVWAQASLDNTAGSARTSSQGDLFLSTGGGPFTAIAGSRGFGYHRNSANGEGTIPCFKGLDLVAGDVIRYAAIRIAGAGPLEFIGNACRLGIIRVPSL